MNVFQGYSSSHDARSAVEEATAGWDLSGQGLDILFAFTSTGRSAEDVAGELATRFPGTRIVGCTTAGEHVSGRHLKGSLVLTALRTPSIRWASALLDDVRGLAPARAARTVEALFRDLDADPTSFVPSEYFCVLLVDGLSMREEALAATVADALDGVTLMGGSSGDDLAFLETRVIHGGTAATNAAVLLLGHSLTPFSVIKHQHFSTTSKSLVITRADVSARTVHEMDGWPAVTAYARALGIEPGALTDSVTFANPLIFSCQGELYVRSIQRLNADGSITFYCAVEEGMVLDVGGHEDMVATLARDLAPALPRSERAAFFLGFNCILRALEADAADCHQALGDVLLRHARAVVGFDTYGEQLRGLHINQTLVGLALGLSGEA